MMTLAPVAVELGWLLVSNTASLPIEPEAVLAGYRDAAARAARTGLRLGRRWADADPAGDAATDPAAARPRADDRRLGRAAWT